MTEGWMRVAAIALGGAAGAVARYGVGVASVRLLGDRFAWGTLAVNVVGCFLIGVLMHEAWSHHRASHWHDGLTVGVLGGLTTYSAFGYQTVRHLETGDPLLAVANVGLNLALGLGGVALGLAAARWVG
jgi:CrcB protein